MLPAEDRVDMIVNGRGDSLICIRVSIDSELSPPENKLGCDILKFITGELMVLVISYTITP